MALAPAHWRLRLATHAALADALETALEALPEPPFATARVDAGRGAWVIEALFWAPPDPDELTARLAPIAGEAMPVIDLQPIAPTDWVREVEAALPPVRAGRFLLYGAHDRGVGTPNLWRFEIEAGEAFGTGHHETTRLCLEILSRHTKRGRARRVLDLGCGSGVLAMGAARAWRTRVMASDIDPVAIAVARDNARKAGLVPWIGFVCADGLAAPALRQAAPYDLIFANILARPLITLAPALTRLLAPGGTVVLSGLLAEQLAGVRAAYRGQGLIADKLRRENDWVALSLRRPRR